MQALERETLLIISQKEIFERTTSHANIIKLAAEHKLISYPYEKRERGTIVKEWWMRSKDNTLEYIIDNAYGAHVIRKKSEQNDEITLRGNFGLFSLYEATVNQGLTVVRLYDEGKDAFALLPDSRRGIRHQVKSVAMGIVTSMPKGVANDWGINPLQLYNSEDYNDSLYYIRET